MFIIHLVLVILLMIVGPIAYFSLYDLLYKKKFNQTVHPAEEYTK
ncbi:hypothetical protein [Bacillus sp. Brlt_9]